METHNHHHPRIRVSYDVRKLVEGNSSVKEQWRTLDRLRAAQRTEAERVLREQTPHSTERN